MQTYEIIVSGRAVHANSADTTLVRTSIGIDKIHVLFDNEEWTSFPVRVTFANGDTIISTSLTLAEIDAPEWAAEAECAIPWEVIQDLGGIRITFQGTDASGNHIITEASGEPLSVVEAGDVGSGTVPSPAPSVDEWNQAYANAMAAANSASGAAESANEAADRANAAAADAEQVLADGIPLMDADTRGGAKLGDGLEVDENEALNAKVGGDISIDNNGAISYELPIMSATQHGGATLGSGLTVDDGALSLGDLVQSGSGAEVVTDGCAIYSVSGEGWATQDGTPTPDNPVEIEVARGRNLFDGTINNTAPADTGSGWRVTSNSNYRSFYFPAEPNTTYTVSRSVVSGNRFRIYSAQTVPINDVPLTVMVDSANTSLSETFMTLSSTKYVYVYLANDGSEITGNIQAELGTTPTPYVPYGHVGLEVTHDGTTTVTPIPLPAKGFAASLPDGTADALTVDSAGRWEWTGVTGLHNQTSNVSSVNNFTAITNGARFNIDFDGMAAEQIPTGSENGLANIAKFLRDAGGLPTYGSHVFAYGNKLYYVIDGIETAADAVTFVNEHYATVLYPLATPTTEHGYIDLPALPSGATVSIPELEQIGCAWFVDGCEPIVEHAANIKPATESRIGGVKPDGTSITVDNDGTIHSSSSGYVSPISNATIDSVVSDQSPTGTDSLQTTGLSYLWGKLKAAFASITHTHTVLGDSNTKTVTATASGISVCNGTAHGDNSCAEANGYAGGTSSHAEGTGTNASGYTSHAEGLGTTAAGEASHAEGAGAQTSSSARASHAEGSQTAVTAEAAHAEGRGSTASGIAAHSEGQQAQAWGAASHAEGTGTIAGSASQHVSGKYNVTDTSDEYAEIVGNGTNLAESNARTLDWDGNAWHAGDVVATDGSNNQVSLVDLKAAVGDVDVSTDGSLQEQINALGESVSHAKFSQSFSVSGNNQSSVSFSNVYKSGYKVVSMTTIIDSPTNGSHKLVTSIVKAYNYGALQEGTVYIGIINNTTTSYEGILYLDVVYLAL